MPMGDETCPGWGGALCDDGRCVWGFGRDVTMYHRRMGCGIADKKREPLFLVCGRGWGLSVCMCVTLILDAVCESGSIMTLHVHNPSQPYTPINPIDQHPSTEASTHTHTHIFLHTCPPAFPSRAPRPPLRLNGKTASSQHAASRCMCV